MRDFIKNYRENEDGASLVEYAVALIVVTIVGGAGVIAIGTGSGTLATNANGVVQTAVGESNTATTPATGG